MYIEAGKKNSELSSILSLYLPVIFFSSPLWSI